MKPPMSYQGSKVKEIKKIHENAPEDFDIIVDVFGGGGSVFLSYIETKKCHYNEIDKKLCDMFNILKDSQETEKLINNLKKIDCNDRDFFKNVFEYKSDLSEIERFLYLTKLSMMGMVNSGKIKLRKCKTTGLLISEGRCLKTFFDLDRFNGKLDNTIITNKSYKYILEEYKDNDKAFLYLDPPYLLTSCTGYDKTTFKFEDLQYIFKCMKDENYKCKIMLNIDYTGYTREAFPELFKCCYPISYNMSSFNAYQKYHIILCNY